MLRARAGRAALAKAGKQALWEGRAAQGRRCAPGHLELQEASVGRLWHALRRALTLLRLHARRRILVHLVLQPTTPQDSHKLGYNEALDLP